MVIQDTSTIYLNFFDQITDQKVKILMAICSELIAKHHPKQLYFLFSSTGGSVRAGITLYNFLRSLPVEIVMHNVGSIDSIATVIYMAGEKRYAAKHSTFLFHGIVSMIEQPTQITKSKFKELLSGLEKDENKIAGIISDRSSLTEKEIRKLFLQGEAKDLSFALKKGVIQEVRDPSIPNNAALISLNLQ